MSHDQQLKVELEKINLLLRDVSFAAVIAEKQEAAYYASLQKTPPVFYEGKDSVLKKSYSEEKIAINLAGLYATECGIGALMQSNGEKPVYWLRKIAGGSIDTGSMQLMTRFANATWKAGQPFRSLSRITRENFIVASFLSDNEIQKDIQQIRSAAFMLLDALENEAGATLQIQLEKINSLLHDKSAAWTIARQQEAAYYEGLGETVPPFPSATDEDRTIEKSVHEEKIATNLAGFYGLECGLNYLVTTQHKLPSHILQSILRDDIQEDEKKLLERFANATWKAGQPFRGLDRITRDTFTCFDLLTNAEVEKDWVQVKAAADVLLEKLGCSS